MGLLQIAETHPQLLAQLGVSKEHLEMMKERASKDKQITKMTQEEKDVFDRNTWMEWLLDYR